MAGGKGVARTARLADDELGSLVRSAQRGRRRALDALLAKLRPWFVGFFARWVDDRDTAEDLAQAALVRVWQALPRIRADRPVHYIVTIAMNLLRTAREDLRRAERRRATLKLNPPMAAPVTPDREAEDRDLTRLVHQLSLTTLSPELHEVVVGLLRGLRQSEIAADQNINAVTVRTRVRRARERLGPRLRKHLVREATLMESPYRRDAPVATPGGPWRQ